MRAAEPVLWVVYRMADDRKADGRNVVCEQSEWDEMERRRPGHYRLVREGIENEAEAERLARGTSGDALKSGYSRRRS
jgi:hypothetical protein